MADAPSNVAASEQGANLLHELPEFEEWRFGADGNTLHRLQLVGFNLYRALCRLAQNGPYSVLGEARTCVGGILDANELGPLWIVAAHGEEVAGPCTSDGDWQLLDRFRDAPIEACCGSPPVGSREMTCVWSVFPRANEHRGRWDQSALVRYARCYLDVATRTMVAMVDAATGDVHGKGEPAAVCCVFNPAGGGAFLRGVGQPLEGDLGRLIPCLLAAAFVRTQRLRPVTSVCLILTGVRAHSSTEVVNPLLQVPSGTESLLRAATGGADLSALFDGCADGEARLPANARAGMVDMLSAGRAVLTRWPRTHVAVSMAGDARRLGNAFLGLAPHHGRSVRAADPHNAARRAADENNTRRTTMMDVALASGGVGRNGAGAAGPPSRLAAAAEALRGAYMQLEAGGGVRLSRDEIIAAHEPAVCGGKLTPTAMRRGHLSRGSGAGDLTSTPANRLDVCLRDMRAAEDELASGGARSVRDALSRLMAESQPHVRLLTNLPRPLRPAGAGESGTRA
jgi:hypothetical protein